jgi:hypothetical protein
MKLGDLVKVTINVNQHGRLNALAVVPTPPDEFVGIYIGPDHGYSSNWCRHLVMYDGGVWTTPRYQIEVLTETR